MHDDADDASDARNRGRDDGLQHYLAQIRRYPLLTPVEQIELAKRVEAGDSRAFEQMVLCNLRLVVAVARTYETRGVSLVDLVQEGSTGLMRAVERFDWRRGVRFSTYAIWWIRSACRQAREDGATAVRLPASLSGRRRQLRSLDEMLTARLGRQATADELAEAAHLTPRQVARAAGRAPTTRSLSDAVAPNSDEMLVDTIAAETTDWDGDIARVQARRVLTAAVARLPERACTVITAAYDLDGRGPRSRRQIAGELGLTTERVRQIESDALARLARGRQVQELREVVC